MRVLSPLLLIAVVLGSDVALAQKEVIFGTSKPPVFRAESLDQRFRRTRLSTALRSGQIGPECVQVVGGLLTAVAETGMQFHKRDENLFLHQSLSHAIDTQLSSPTFNGRAYYLALVREVLISGRVPAPWLTVAEALAPAYPALDLGKLSFLAKGVQPIDSFHFTLTTLRQQYEVEVRQATSVNASSAFQNFKDDYTDRQVAWGELTLADLKLETPKGKDGFDSYEAPKQVAILHIPRPQPLAHDDRLDRFLGGKKRPKGPLVKVRAELHPTQYLSLDRLPKGTRLMVRGRLWSFNKDVSEVEIRDAQLFLDPDWSRGATLALPGAINGCELAVNDLTGLAPAQPSGFGH